MNGGNTNAADSGNRGQEDKNRKPDTETSAPPTKKQKTVESNGNKF